jgi:hypothetical protein
MVVVAAAAAAVAVEQCLVSPPHRTTAVAVAAAAVLVAAVEPQEPVVSLAEAPLASSLSTPQVFKSSTPPSSREVVGVVVQEALVETAVPLVRVADVAQVQISLPMVDWAALVKVGLVVDMLVVEQAVFPWASTARAHRLLPQAQP